MKGLDLAGRTPRDKTNINAENVVIFGTQVVANF